MRPMLTRSTQAVVCVAAMLTLAACAGDADGEKTAVSSSATQSEATYDDEYAYSQAKEVQSKVRGVKSNVSLPSDTEWATASYIKTYNDDVTEQRKAGVVEKGTVTTDAIHSVESNPDAPGGWDLTIYQCSTSTIRYFKDGKDVTVRPEDPSKILPKGPQKNVHLLSFKTPDEGKTWQIDKVQQVYGDDAKETPCADG